MTLRRLVPILVVVALAVSSAAHAAATDEDALAQRFSPVVRLVEQPEECGPGEPFEPTDVDLLFGDPTVALRGPWNSTDLVEIGPAATDLVDRYEYHLDYPGNPLDPGCGYELWARRLTAGSSPTVYAHVASDVPGRLSLQYWLFYPFNDFNNTHEGDWEMIQLVFDAPDAAAALTEVPTEVGYSSHEGAERADWGDDRDDKLEVVDETHPVVYPAAGSHANKFTAALYLGNSAEQGVGCDDTLGPHREVRPVVRTIPGDPGEARDAFPWIAFEGRWGELRPAFFNGPTGPNLKTQWTAPIAWSEGWRPRSYAVPAGGVLGTRATDFFCTAVARGSTALSRALQSPEEMLIVLALLGAAAIWAAVRATWTPVAPLRLARRRTWGQTLSAACRVYLDHPWLFGGLGLLFVPIALVMSLLQSLVSGGVGLAGTSLTGTPAGLLALLVAAIGALTAVGALALVQGATVCALAELDAGRRPGPLGAYRLALRRGRPLAGAVGAMVLVIGALSTTAFLIPVAVWLAVRWALVAQVVELEELAALPALRRSGSIVRGRWLRVASLSVGAVLIVLVSGPLLGALVILLTDAPFALVNLVAGVVYAVLLPLVSLTTSYVYFDARVRHELEPESGPEELPAEIALRPS